MNISIFWFLVNNASIHLTLQLQQEGILQSRFMWHMTNFSISPSPRRVFPEVRIWLAQELMCSQKLDAECCSWSAQQQHALSWQEFALQEMDSLLCDLFRAPANHLRSCEFVINIHEAHIIFVITEKRYGFGCSVSSGRVGGLANRHPECSLRVFSSVAAVITSRPSGSRVMPVQMAKLAMNLWSTHSAPIARYLWWFCFRFNQLTTNTLQSNSMWMRLFFIFWNLPWEWWHHASSAGNRCRRNSQKEIQ